MAHRSVSELAGQLQSPQGRVDSTRTRIARIDAELAQLAETLEASREQAVNKACGVAFYNAKCVTFEDLVGDSDNLGANFLEFIGAYSKSIAEIVKGLKFRDEVEFMIKKGLLFEVVKAFAALANGCC